MKFVRKKYFGSAQIMVCLPVMFIVTVLSCQRPGPTPVQPYIIIPTFYKTNGGVDLLNPATPNSFKKEDIKVISKIEINGIIKEISYSENGIGGIYIDDATGFNYLELTVPTNYGKNPLETYVQLNPSITDTLTYTFVSLNFPSLPDKIFYHKKLVWDISNAQKDKNWPPITFIK